MIFPLHHVSLDAVGSRVLDYIEAFYSQLREDLDQFQSILDQIPDFYKGKRRVMVTFGWDGVVVAHYFAAEDSIALGVKYVASADIMERVCGMAVRGRGPITGLTYYCDERRSKIALASAGERDELAIAEWSSDLSLRRWSEEAGRQTAKYEIFSRVTAKLLGLLTSEPRSVQDTLEERINAFRALLETNPGEEAVQVFLEQNPVLLHPTAVKITPKVRLGAEYVTDFVIELVDDEYILVEIEAPHHKVVNQKGDQTAAVTHAVGQVTDWKRWVITNGDYARKVPALSEVEDPDGLVIIGRRPESSRDRKRIKQTNRQNNSVTIQTYDDLLRQAEQYLQNLRTYLAPPPGS